MELVCIVCPRSCHITVDGDNITGNFCPRGAKFAKEEAVAPKRSVTSTVATKYKDFPVLPVITDGEILKSQIPELMNLIKGLYITKPLKYGEIVAENILNSGVNLVASATVRSEEA